MVRCQINELVNKGAVPCSTVCRDHLKKRKKSTNWIVRRITNVRKAFIGIRTLIDLKVLWTRCKAQSEPDFCLSAHLVLCESEHAIFMSNQVANVLHGKSSVAYFLFQLIPLAPAPPTYRITSRFMFLSEIVYELLTHSFSLSHCRSEGFRSAMSVSERSAVREQWRWWRWVKHVISHHHVQAA